ncbi:DUF6126 family protein [Phaeacidiphilus oryzae]|jgi:type VI protein secretion system component VasF|uniref:DUF6126 family protein n=1 Tax=Phaeacidiphilus oryzae TaxID=348818 RepID=UPI000AA40161|nr:DUF6126 family protein [Phaeacidiphilus oryzae]
MTAPSHPRPSSAGAADDGSTRTERRVAARVFIYIFALHLLVALILLMFTFAPKH